MVTLILRLEANPFNSSLYVCNKCSVLLCPDTYAPHQFVWFNSHFPDWGLGNWAPQMRNARCRVVCMAIVCVCASVSTYHAEVLCIEKDPPPQTWGETEFDSDSSPHTCLSHRPNLYIWCQPQCFVGLIVTLQLHRLRPPPFRCLSFSQHPCSNCVGQETDLSLRSTVLSGGVRSQFKNCVAQVFPTSYQEDTHEHWHIKGHPLLSSSLLLDSGLSRSSNLCQSRSSYQKNYCCHCTGSTDKMFSCLKDCITTKSSGYNVPAINRPKCILPSFVNHKTKEALPELWQLVNWLPTDFVKCAFKAISM